MNTRYKRWIFAPIATLALFTFAFASNIAQAASPCDIQLTQPSYSNGQTVSLNVFRLTNSSAETQFYEWKLWLKSPALPDQSLVNIGYDSSLALPAGFDVDFAALLGPIVLFTIDNVLFSNGSYEIGCRLINPITGQEYPDADVITFDVI